MSRSHFGGTSVDWLLRPYPFGGTTLVALKTGTTTLNFYSTETGGTHYTDLLDEDSNPVSQVSVTDHQIPEFQGPDAILAMWADKGDGSQRERMEAQDLAAAASAVSDAEDAAAAAAADASAAAASAASAASAATAAATAALATKVSKGDLVYNLADHNVLPANSAATNATSFATAAASGATNFYLPPGTYNIQKTEGQILCSFANTNHIRIRGDNAVLNDTTTYTNGGAFTTMFYFDNCDDFEVSGIDYVGPTIGTPTTNHGYQGAIFVRAINGCNGGKVDARLTNLRYGFQTGEYGDASKGACSNFDINLRGTMVGYGIAAYLADGIRHDLDLDGVHRVAYIAGCNDVTGVARWKNAYIASPTYLITDCLISGTDAAAQVAPPANPTTSRGSTNIDVTSIDMGSTVWPSGGTFCAGLTLSRVDAVTFRNIRVKAYSVAVSNSVSPSNGAFYMDSAAKSIWNRYAFNWESTIVIENVDISGVIDHAAASVAGQDMYLIGFESTHAGTLRNFRDDDLTVIPSSASSQVRITPRMRAEQYELESGTDAVPRNDINGATILSTSGVIRLSYFVCPKAFVTSQARMWSGTTAAAATPSLVKMCLFLVKPNGDLTRVAVTASDTALFAATSTAYNRSWTALYTMIPGQAYAAGALVVTAAAAPTYYGQALILSNDAAVSPRLAATLSDTDVASSYSAGSAGTQRPYIAILP